MDASRELWLDGEKIPDERIREIFRPPPIVPSAFHRSSLIIGSKGAGKTTIFRYQKSMHNGLALHISLPTEFASLTKQTAYGPLTIEYPTDLELFIIGKATSLLAVSVAERFVRKGLPTPLEPFRECIPGEIFPSSSNIDAKWCSTLKKKVSRSPLELFGPVAETRPLPSFMNSLGECSQKESGPLLLMLDRADMVPTPTIVPVIELLDQSSGYIALVATRPGHGSGTITRLAGQAVPGDHYAVVHLGTLPRSIDWVDFVRSAVAAQLGDGAISCLSEEVKSGIIAISRDSLRVALELFARIVDSPPTESKDRLFLAIEDLRENNMVAVQRTLQTYHPNFREVIKGVRDQVLSQKNVIDGPVLLSIERRMPQNLFDTTSHLEPFVEVSLRSGALCMPEGERWIPGLLPTELEVPPILLWRKGDPLWNCKKALPFRITQREGKVLRVRRGVGQAPTVFVAYRMEFEESKQFRQNLESAIGMHPNLANFRVIDGRVRPGVEWADEIRKRIKSAKVVVADVTGMRPDVLFELGFAFGLRRLVIPVVSKPEERTDLPYWLGATQFGQYGVKGGLRGIVSSIEAYFFDPTFSKIRRPPEPVPSLAVWMRVLDWNRTSSDQFVTAIQRAGLKFEVLDDQMKDELLIRRGGSATLLAVSLDGTTRDALIHYICGVVVSKPYAGYASKRLARKIIVLEPEGVEKRTFAADSLSRCGDTVAITCAEKVLDETTPFTECHRRWLSGGSERRRKNPCLEK